MVALLLRDLLNFAMKYCNKLFLKSNNLRMEIKLLGKNVVWVHPVLRDKSLAINHK